MNIYLFNRRNLVTLPALVFLCFVFTSLVTSQSLIDKTIVIDAGHGGIDPGANRPGIIEKDINLAVTLKLRDVLTSYGANVVLTRETDIELSQFCDNTKVRGRYRRDLTARKETISEANADLFISIHANASSKPRRKGIECYYTAKSESGKKLAYSIQEELRKIASVSQEAEPADFFVLRRNTVPAVLVEIGFITNPEEGELLKTPAYQEKLAKAIVSGIIKYY